MNFFVTALVLIGTNCGFVNLPSIESAVREAKFKSAISLPDLKEFQGYYQLQDGSDLYIQILTRGNKLVLRQMWDNIEIPFERKSDLEFYNTKRQFPLLFTRSKGKITQVIAFSKDVWKKVGVYTVVKKKEVQLSVKEMQSFEGIYQLGWSEHERLKFTAKGNHLIVTEMWSGKKMIIAPTSALQFFGKEIRSVKFSKDEKGNIKEALLFNRDVWKKVG